ncbi:sensor histidine kinase [Peristeroidobacter agariperforans]|uniref:sensor histidine kinase n=1 Tax=Peristeroidobacter agariperforans TaxID=268404 RepID=UPI00101DC450|nr:ATP-binding protein [Peristeroidobacter agariperforans]
MKAGDVRIPLFLTILVMSAAPLLAAFYLLDQTLATSLNLGFNPQVVRVLDRSSEHLRTLGRLDAEHRDAYRAHFEEVQSLKQVYSDPALIRRGIEGSLKIYFGAGLIATVLLAVLAAALLSRRIAGRYRLVFEELTSQREKVRYLQEMSSWQELARMLAHEIKNPLTPIEVLVSSLSRSYLQKTEPEFRAQLAKTESMINEELAHLKNTVNRFGEFAQLPQVVVAEQDVAEVLAQQVKILAHAIECAEIDLRVQTSGVRARIDSTLLRQVLTNIVRNGLEANPDRLVRFVVDLTSDASEVRLTLTNDGVPVPTNLAPRIFDPYVSSKTGNNNMGLGLAIVKKIVIEHGGDIAYIEQAGQPAFVITLPRVS